MNLEERINTVPEALRTDLRALPADRATALLDRWDTEQAQTVTRLAADLAVQQKVAALPSSLVETARKFKVAPEKIVRYQEKTKK